MDRNFAANAAFFVGASFFSVLMALPLVGWTAEYRSDHFIDFNIDYIPVDR